jgi:hypothetical protein
MAQAKFHSFRGDTSALIGVRVNAFVFQMEYVYVPKEAIPEGISEGDTFEIPDGYKIVPFTDVETGEVRTAKDGSELKVLAY